MSEETAQRDAALLGLTMGGLLFAHFVLKNNSTAKMFLTSFTAGTAAVLLFR